MNSQGNLGLGLRRARTVSLGARGRRQPRGRGASHVAHLAENVSVSLAVQRRAAGTIYAALRPRALRSQARGSTDGGKTWELAPHRFPPRLEGAAPKADPHGRPLTMERAAHLGPLRAAASPGELWCGTIPGRSSTCAMAG